jgi:hypothetical protein
MTEWSGLVETNGEDYRRVAFDKVGDVEVSTVWLGLNHNFHDNGPPLIFETMTFTEDEDNQWFQQCWRWGTETEARAGHEVVVAAVRNIIEEEPI